MESFREKFRGFEDCYTVIGGAACDILMSEADLPFRMTKDIDMILILEDKQAEFAKVFWVSEKGVISVDGRIARICIFTVLLNRRSDIR